MRKTMMWVAALAVSLIGAAQAEEINIHGSTTVEANLFMPHKAELEKMTGLTLNVVGNGSSRGITGIDTGAAQIGMISSGLEGTLKKMDMSDRAAEFIGEQVGDTVATFAVNKANPVHTLTKAQIQGILKGEITNWSAVGGTDAPIVVVTEYAGGGLRGTIEKKVLDKSPITENARALPNASQIAQVTAQIPTAFATISSAALKGTDLVKVESDADVVQPLILVVKGERTDAFNKLVEAAKEVLK